jgi:hypothetical protein
MKIELNLQWRDYGHYDKILCCGDFAFATACNSGYPFEDYVATLINLHKYPSCQTIGRFDTLEETMKFIEDQIKVYLK